MEDLKASVFIIFPSPVGLMFINTTLCFRHLNALYLIGSIKLGVWHSAIRKLKSPNIRTAETIPRACAKKKTKKDSNKTQKPEWKNKKTQFRKQPKTVQSKKINGRFTWGFLKFRQNSILLRRSVRLNFRVWNKVPYQYIYYWDTTSLQGKKISEKGSR